ncbi:uncharacterized protein PG986_014014 [Apiospora aurea]|uniref:Zn(2)-C6 fungal-type domain-containing protein n=1 Tax=Apiospora aurea TaxID=335848 RepID=A0ABR1PX71_9PEZI
MSHPVTAACTPCAKAKRKCGKQKPACLRCHKRGVRCAYPRRSPVPSYSSRTTYLDEGGLGSSSFSGGFFTVNEGGASSTLFQNGVDLDPGIASFLLLDSRAEFQLATAWFVGPDTWTACPMPPTVAAAHTYSQADLESYAQTTRAWLQTWVHTGSNPFIHSRLYKTRCPTCVQDAYLAATSCTSGTGVMVHRTIEEKMLSLLKISVVPSDRPSSPQDLTVSLPLDDPLEHIARVHALLVYQLIGLFEEGNVRLCRLAERHIPVLYRWMCSMVQCCARQTEFLGESVTASPKAADASSSFTARLSCDERIWQTWIMAESARRTWVVISGIQAVYLMVRHQSALIPCMGGMMVTTRKGPWDAASAQEWLRICSEVNVGLVQMAEAHNQFSPSTTAAAIGKSKDPDEFIKFALLVGHGERKVSEWNLWT